VAQVVKANARQPGFAQKPVEGSPQGEAGQDSAVAWGEDQPLVVPGRPRC